MDQTDVLSRLVELFERLGLTEIWEGVQKRL